MGRRKKTCPGCNNSYKKGSHLWGPPSPDCTGPPDFEGNSDDNSSQASVFYSEVDPDEEPQDIPSLRAQRVEMERQLELKKIEHLQRELAALDSHENPQDDAIASSVPAEPVTPVEAETSTGLDKLLETLGLDKPQQQAAGGAAAASVDSNPLLYLRAPKKGVPCHTMSTQPSSKSCISLQASPTISLMDEIVTIEVAGLSPRQPVTLRTYFDNEGKQFETHAHYTSDETGTVNTGSHDSQGGNFIGTEPMGMFWSMVACPGVRHGTRYMKCDVTKPLIIDISAHDGHMNEDTVRNDKSPIAYTSVERWYKARDVEMIKLDRVGKYGLQGTLVKPKGNGPFPGVVDMFGGVLPGCNEIRSALLASHGYAALSLGYFWDTMEGSSFIAVEELEMEYFEEAADWLTSQPYTQPGGIAAVGVCKGGEMATAMAIHFPDKIRATVGISTCGAFTVCPTTYKGKVLPYAHVNSVESAADHAGFSKDGHICLKDFFPGEREHSLFQEFDKIRCPALIICGANDDCVPNHHSDRITELIQNNGHDNPCEMVKYPGAGHLLEPPYAPVCTFSYQPPWGIFRWGGTPRDHAHACEDAWKKLLAFLQENMMDKQQLITSKL